VCGTLSVYSVSKFAVFRERAKRKYGVIGRKRTVTATV
jgi:hypothetical protein